MIVTESNWKLLEEKFKSFCVDNGLDVKKASDLLYIALVTEFHEKEAAKNEFAPEILSIRQSYNDPDKPSVVFSVGDATKDGRILKIAENAGMYYVTTDQPSEWHLRNGQDHGWSWLWELEKIEQ